MDSTRHEEDNPQGDILEGLGFAVGLAALGIALSLGAGVTLSDARDAEITAQLEQEAHDRKAMRPCDITIGQFGPGERWQPHHRAYECARGGELPSYVLTSPLKQ